MVIFISGSPQPASSIQAEITTRQAAAAAMQLERGRSNPGFSELPSVASSLAVPHNRIQSNTAPQQQQAPPQQQAPQLHQAPQLQQQQQAPPPPPNLTKQQPTLPQLQAIPVPTSSSSHPVPAPTSQQPTVNPQQTAPAYTRPVIQQRPRLSNQWAQNVPVLPISIKYGPQQRNYRFRNFHRRKFFSDLKLPGIIGFLSHS